MNKILYHKDGVLYIVNPSNNYPIETVIDRVVPKGIDYWVVDESELPKDRGMRNAWYYDNGIKTDKVKEDEITAKREANKKPTIDEIDKAKDIDDIKKILKKTLMR